MITDEEIEKIHCSDGSVSLHGFARAIYQLGRQHQRDSDAALCKKSDRYRGDYFAEKIMANTGELK